MIPPSTPTFTLIDHHGSPVSERTYRGSWMVVFFGLPAADVTARLRAHLSRG